MTSYSSDRDVPSSGSSDGYSSDITSKTYAQVVAQTPSPPPPVASLKKSYAEAIAEPPPAMAMLKKKSYAEAIAEPPPPTMMLEKIYDEAVSDPSQKTNGELRNSAVAVAKKQTTTTPPQKHRENTTEEGYYKSHYGNGRVKTARRTEKKPTQGRREKEKLVSGHARGLRRMRFAPLKVPLQRRLQMAAVLWHETAMALLLSLFWFLLAIPLCWPILVPYLIYMLSSTAHENGSSPQKRSKFLRSLPLWKLYTSYFPLNLHRTSTLDPSKNYIFAYHPHGIISHGAFGNFCTEGTTGFEGLFPGITNTLLTLDSNFRVPFYREYLLAMGLASVSRKSCEALLRGEGEKKPIKKRTFSVLRPWTWLNIILRSKKSRAETNLGSDGGGRAITIVIGGARESLEARPGIMNLVVLRRRGFLKIAVREGAGVVPVLSFGENELYDQLVPEERSLVHRIQLGIKRTLGFTIPLFHARGVFNYDVGLVPYRRDVNTIVGRPLFPRKQSPNPRDEEIDEFQGRYIAELERMWNEWKDVFAKDRILGQELKVIE